MNAVKTCFILVLIFVICSCAMDIVFDRSVGKKLEKREILKEYNDDFYIVGDDMLIGKRDPQFRGLVNALVNQKLKGVISSWVLPWPNGNIPYCFYDEISTAERETVLSAMETWESEANIAFLEQHRCEDFLPTEEEPDVSDFSVVIDGEEHGVYQIRKGEDSDSRGRSTLGYSSNSQRFYEFIDNEYGVALHELGHCIGFSHEHQRPDRDDYISIFWHNIKLDYIHNFFSVPLNSATYSDVYDYDSIMHYSDKAFVKRWFLESISSHGRDIGQREYLSYLDRLNAMCLYCSEYESTNSEHLAQNRATSDFRAIGSNDLLGVEDEVTTLRETRRNHFELGSCCNQIPFGRAEERQRYTFTSSDLYDGSVGIRLHRSTGEAIAIEDNSRVVSGHEANEANDSDIYYQGILSFNISDIPDDHRIVSIHLQARFFNMNGPTDDNFIRDLSENLRIDFDGYFGDVLELEGYNDFGYYHPPTEFWFEPEISILSDPAPHLPDIVTLSAENSREVVNKFTWVLIELRHDFPRYHERENTRVLQLRIVTSANYLTGVQGFLSIKPQLIVETIHM